VLISQNLPLLTTIRARYDVSEALRLSVDVMRLAANLCWIGFLWLLMPPPALTFQTPVKNWIVLSTPGLELYTNAGARTGRDAMRNLDQIDRLFQRLAGAPVARRKPIRVFVFDSRRSFQPFALEGSPPNRVGYYQRGRERDLIVMRAVPAGETYRVVYHEYVHLKMHALNPSIPLWLDEGLAEFYSTARFEGSKVLVGAPVRQHVENLRRHELMSLPELFATTRHSERYDSDEASLFYSQCWALVHMLQVHDAYRAQTPAFLRLLAAGTPELDAIDRAFKKNAATLHRDLASYVRQDHFEVLHVSDVPAATDAEITERAVSEVEATIALAELSSDIGKAEQASALLNGMDQSSLGDHRTLAARGWQALAARQEDAAQELFRQAVAGGSRSARLHYEYANLLRRSPEQAAQARAVLRLAMDLDPQDAEIAYLLGHLESEAHLYEEAAGHLQHAVALQPHHIRSCHAYTLALHHAGRSEAASEAAAACRKHALTAEDVALTEAALALVAQPVSLEAKGPEIRRGQSRLMGHDLPSGSGAASSGASTGPLLAPPAGAKPPSGDASAPEPPYLTRNARRAQSQMRETVVSEEFQMPQGDQLVHGVLERVDCLRDQARLVVRSGETRLSLLVREPQRVTLVAAPGNSITAELRCGPQRTAVSVEYRARRDAKAGTAGDVTMIEFRDSR
jgi:tetratricopeptide (TPR) repeat protein